MTPIGTEHPNTCPLHFGNPLVAGDCHLCLLAGLKVVIVDPGDVDQTIAAMDDVGATYLRHRSRAVLTFERPEGPMKPGDLIPKKPGARAAGVSPTTRTNGRASA